MKQWDDERGGASAPAARLLPSPTTPSRTPVREERHPNSVTAPPVHRGSMPPRPWRGFWNGVATGLLSTLTHRPADRRHAAAGKRPHGAAAACSAPSRC